MLQTFRPYKQAASGTPPKKLKKKEDVVYKTVYNTPHVECILQVIRRSSYHDGLLGVYVVHLVVTEGTLVAGETESLFLDVRRSLSLLSHDIQQSYEARQHFNVLLICLHTEIKVKVCFYIAQYPVRWSLDCSKPFTILPLPRQTC